MCIKTDFMNKIHLEQEDFKERIMAFSKEEMLHHCYEYAVKADIVYYLEDNELNDEEYMLLMGSPCVLEDIFRTFNRFDSDEYMETIGEAVAKTAESFRTEDEEPMERTIKVVLLEPGKLARAAEISTDLKSMQVAVGGGFIEAFYPFEEEVCIVCNDEGKILGMPLNRAVKDEKGEIIDIIAGSAFICDCSGENFGSLNEKQIERYIDMFRYPQLFFMEDDKITAVDFPAFED